MMAGRLNSRIVRYGIAGVLSNLIGYGLFLLLLAVLENAIVASGLTYVIVLSANYLVSRKWVFKSRSTHKTDVPTYLLAYGLGLATTIVSMKILSGYMRAEFAQLVVVVLSALVIYGSLVVLRFGRRGVGSAH